VSGRAGSRGDHRVIAIDRGSIGGTIFRERVFPRDGAAIGDPERISRATGDSADGFRRDYGHNWRLSSNRTVRCEGSGY